MSKVPSIVPISDLREDAANILGRMKNSHEPVVITQRGRAAAVMVSVEEYERSTHETRNPSSPGARGQGSRCG